MDVRSAYLFCAGVITTPTGIAKRYGQQRGEIGKVSGIQKKMVWMKF
jgi:hypothetical protein